MGGMPGRLMGVVTGIPGMTGMGGISDWAEFGW